MGCGTSLVLGDGGVELFLVVGVNVRVVLIIFSDRVLLNVGLLSFKILGIADAVLVIASVPDFAWELFANRKEYPPLMSWMHTDVLWSWAGVMSTWIWSGMMTNACKAKRPWLR